MLEYAQKIVIQSKLPSYTSDMSGNGYYFNLTDNKIISNEEIKNNNDKDLYYIENWLSNDGSIYTERIAIQGEPGSVMCIDGEKIIIEENGIFEINYPLNINFVGFVNLQDTSKMFIIDYVYEEVG